MKRRCRWWGKLAGLIVACAIALVWFDSRWHGGVSCIGGGAGRIVLLIGRGQIMCGSAPPWMRPRVFEFLPGGIADAGPGWSWGFVLTLGPTWTVAVPLWFPFIAVAASTAWLWRQDGRRPANCCARCGYDQSGISSRVCPECGRAKGQAEATRVPPA